MKIATFKGFRMKKLTTFLLSTLMVLMSGCMGAIPGFGEKAREDISGEWLMAKMQSATETREDYTPSEFTKDGKFLIMGMEFGEYTYDKKAQMLTMTSTRDKNIPGVYSVKKLTQKSLILQNSKYTLTFISFNPKQVEQDNASSKFIGSWSSEVKGSEYGDGKEVFKFSLPDNFAYTFMGDGMRSSTKGTWLYEKDSNSLIVLARDVPFAGKHHVVHIGEKEFVLQTKEGKYSAQKEKELKIERLNFSEKDFDEGRPPYAPANWEDLYSLIDYLDTLESVEYKVLSLVGEITDKQIVKTTFEINSEKPSVTLHTYNSEGEEIDRVLRDNRFENSSNGFFPQKELYPLKKVANETLTLGAGVFECSVYEGMEGESKYRLWMVDTMPGIYAKIIEDGEDRFGKPSFKVTELQAIKRK